MATLVAVPWRASQDKDRSASLEHVIEHLYTVTERPVRLVDSGHAKFNRAASRNMAFDIARAEGHEVVVVCDADTIIEAAPLTEAISQAVGDDVVHFPFNRYRRLTRHSSIVVMGGVDPRAVPADAESVGGVGGCMVASPWGWARAGGMDDRFTGWGYEDSAFALAIESLIGPLARHEGCAHHLWHADEATIGSPSAAENALLFDRYECSDDMASLVLERFIA